MNQVQWEALKKNPVTIYFYGADGNLHAGTVENITPRGATIVVKNQRAEEASDLKDRKYFPYQALHTEEEYQRQRETRKKNGTIRIAVCEICGKTFETDSPTRKTCSSDCRKKKCSLAASKSHKGINFSLKGNMTEEERRKVCPECHKGFKAIAKKQIYCSKHCADEHHNRVRREERARRKA